MALVVASGHPAVDRYLAEGFDAVRGMSSRFATAICGHLMRRQTELGIKGSIAEIGTFEGRFFIALALALAEGERAYGFDTFDWPDTGVQERFVANCRSSGVDLTRIEAVKRDSRQMNARELKDLLGPDPVRFFHIDGDHGLESLAHDLALAHAVLHPQGVICTDDMLHPEYPFLVLAVHDYLRAHPEMRLLCVIDREDIVAAAKFLICRADAVALYEEDLMASFRPVQYLMGGDALGHLCVVLTPSPRIFSVG
jgi:predicted O-methyltransferase YrrM